MAIYIGVGVGGGVRARRQPIVILETKWPGNERRLGLGLDLEL